MALRIDGDASDPDLTALFVAFERRLTSAGRRPTLRSWLACAETWRILEALRQAHGNRSAAARALGIGRRTLYTKMEKLGIRPDAGLSRDADPGRLPSARTA